jgi:hypothetical protein
MDHQQIHFEVFARRAGGGGFNLELATEDREKALGAAEEMLQGPRVVAVKVTKEIRDPETGEFKSVTILKKGDEGLPKVKVHVEEPAPPCVSPQDFYNIHARDRIGRLLEGWLARYRATPFELLHRPDLIERLEASGNELQHAVQKIAVPESQARGIRVHEVIRHFQQLIQRAIDRVLTDHQRGAFPDFRAEGFAAACQRLAEEPERGYLLGAGVAGYIAPAASWNEKVDLLLDLADQAPSAGAGRRLAFSVIEPPLSEILRTRVGLAELLGKDLDLGGQIAGLTRLVATDAVAALARADASIGRQIPPLQNPAKRLAGWMDDPHFEVVSLALFRRILTELSSPRRLRPSDPRGEIDLLRALAMALTAASGPFLQLEEVREAFIERSRMMVASDFVTAYLAEPRPPMQEALDLVWLLENVTGGANKRQAMRWLMTVITSLKFESALGGPSDTAAAKFVKLAELADLHRQLGRSGVDVGGLKEVLDRIGDIGGRIEAEAKLTAALGRSSGPLTQRLSALVKMAAGDTAPPGPASDRARTEVLRLMRQPEALTELAKAPDALAHVRNFMQAIEQAA